MARLAKREKASLWTVLLSAATPEASFITECIRELPRVHLDPDAAPGPLQQRVLHAERRNNTKNHKYSFDSTDFYQNLKSNVKKKKQGLQTQGLQTHAMHCVVSKQEHIMHSYNKAKQTKTGGLLQP